METAANPTETPPQTKQIKRRITFADAECIAKHVARGMTETDACWKVLDMPPNRWFCWKNKAKRLDKCNNLFARMKSARLDNLVDNIEDAATGRREGVRHDWRAAQFLAGVIEPNFRVNKEASVTINNQTAIVAGIGGGEALSKLVESIAAQRRLSQPKQIASQPIPTNE